MRQPIQRVMAASMASFSGLALPELAGDVVGEVAAVAGVEEVADPLGRGGGHLRDPAGGDVPGLGGVGGGVVLDAAMVPQKPHSVFWVGRIVVVIVVLRSSVCLTPHMLASAHDPSR